MSLLAVKDLQVKFNTPEGIVTAVNKLSFSIEQGETLGIVGESGSGKSQTAFSLMGLQPDNAIITGSAVFKRQQLLNLSTSQLNQIRSKQISMIFQDPMTSLNPYVRISDQMAEVLTLHKGMSKRQGIRAHVGRRAHPRRCQSHPQLSA